MKALICFGLALGLAGFMMQAALAQPAPTSAQATFDSLLAAGYEIKAVTVMSDATAKEVFPGETITTSQMFVTLQKGTSVAVCKNATVTWLTLADVNLTDPTRCYKR
jgi:hypothetical protein